MKTAMTVLAIAALCVCVWAADNAVVGARPTANHQSPIAGRQLLDAITIPRMLSYQGKLTDTLGQPVPNGNYQLTFRLYTQPTGGSAIWTEAQTIPVVTGLFSALLGAVTPISSVPDGGALYLSLQVAINPELTPRLRIASAAYSYKADTANYALAGGTPEYAWVRGTPDSVLYTVGNLGIARGGAGNMLHGTQRFSHVNLGVACTTGTSGTNNSYCTVGGGQQNTASGNRAVVGGGWQNTAGGHYATVGGGQNNTASEDYSFATNYSSEANHTYSAAFNQQHTTASNQLRCGVLSKTGGSFTIDHPLQPMSTILNHYFVESPDMSNIYSGSVVLDAAGRAEVNLPDYFDALNRNPRVQLTGVGTAAVVFVAEDVQGNRFTIGGPANTKVYWTVTGDRKDPSAEVIRLIMPVEQPKTGKLAGHSLDDDFLAGTMKQLEEMGESGRFGFRTAEGRAQYQESLRDPAERK